MGFFKDAKNVNINGGQFNEINGNCTVYHQRRFETNINSNNMCNNTITDSYNNNSKRFYGRDPRSRFPRADEEDNEMDWMPSTSADDRREDHIGGPLPYHPPFMHMPQQLSSRSGHVANHDSFNMMNNQISDSFNNSPQTHYAPPTSQRRRFRPQSKSTNEEEEEEKDFQSNNGPRRGGQTKAPGQAPFQAGMPRYMRTQSFSKGNTSNMPESSDENSESDDADSSSSHTKDPMNTGRMADLSIGDGMPSSTSRDESRPKATPPFPPSTFSRTESARNPFIPQTNFSHSMGSSYPSNLDGSRPITTPLSAPPTFSRTNSVQNPFDPQVNPSHPMGFSNSSNLDNSRPIAYPVSAPSTFSGTKSSRNPFNPQVNPSHSMGPSNPPNPRSYTENENHGHSHPNWPPPASTSAFNPRASSNSWGFGNTYEDPTEYDSGAYQTQENVSSYNMEGNTITRSFDGESTPHSSGRRKEKTKKDRGSRRK